MNNNPGIWANVIEDTCLSKNRSVRFTTFHVRFPRCILAEVNTHRMLSKNAASSRAIPAAKLIKQIRENPFIPQFALNQKGMQSGELLSEKDLLKAEVTWAAQKIGSIEAAEYLTNILKVHKQFANRLLEPWMFCEIIISGTEWTNFFHQRCHPAAEPSMQELAIKMRVAYETSIPRILTDENGEDHLDNWHIPFINDIPEELDLRPGYLKVVEHLADKFVRPTKEIFNEYSRQRWSERWIQDVSAGRIAKISYLNLETEKIDPLNDVRLAVQLSSSDPGHWSPFEHIATPAKFEEMVFKPSQLTAEVKEVIPHFEDEVTLMPKPWELGFCGNLKGYKQYRKEFSNENFTG